MHPRQPFPPEVGSERRTFRPGFSRLQPKDVCPPLAEIERSPGDEHSRRAPPHVRKIVRAEHRSGHRRNHGLREDHAENVVSRGPIDLSEEVCAGRVSGAGQIYRRRGRGDELLNRR